MLKWSRYECVCVCVRRSVCLCLMSTFDFWQVNCNVRGSSSSSSSMKKQRFRHVNNWRAQPQCDSRGRSANRQTEAESVGPQTGAASGTHKTQINKWKAWLPFAFAFTFDFFQSYFISGTLFACLPHQFQFYWQAAQRINCVDCLNTLSRYQLFTHRKCAIKFRILSRESTQSKLHHSTWALYCPVDRIDGAHLTFCKSRFYLPWSLLREPQRSRLPWPALILIVLFAYHNVLTMRSCLNWNRLARCAALCRVLVPRHKQLITHLICADIWGPKTTRPQWQADWTRWCAALAAH